MKPKKRNILVKSKFTVPHYGSEVWVVVATDALLALNKMRKRFKEKEIETKEFGALCIDDEENRIGVFFYADRVTNEFVAHEIDHVAGTILGHWEAPTQPGCPSCGEHRAMLNGVITERLRRVLSKFKIKVQL
jgi:hypothetical protein